MSAGNFKLTAQINAYCLWNIPLLAFITPRVVALSSERAEIRVRLDRRTRNHLGGMYFGALAMGAELSVALQALQSIADSKQRISFIFKDFKAEFLKRSENHTHFVCLETQKIHDLVQRSIENDARVEGCFSGFAYVPDKSEEPIMKYQLTLSLKKTSRAKGDST